jgi:nitric oxide synthase-interacting protein
LCLSHLVDPVASPSGNLFCRECIFKNLLAQKEALDVQKKAYDEWKRLKAAETSAAAAGLHAAAIHAFETLEGGVSSSLKSAYPQSAESITLQDERRVVEEASKPKSDKVDNRSRDEKREEMRKASFWIPESSPEAKESGVPPPDPAPRDPVSGEFLRAKQLTTLHLSLASPPATDDDDTGVRAAADGSGAVGRFMCPACMKTIVFQQTYLFKTCGHVLCDKCVSQFVAPTKRCFVCTASVSLCSLQKHIESTIASTISVLCRY